MPESPQSRPFNERAALEELERLAEKIQSSRRQREAAVAEFESFVKTFRHDRYAQLIAQHEGQRASAQAAPAVSRRSPGASASSAPSAPAVPELGIVASEHTPVRPAAAAATSVSSLVNSQYFRPALAAAAIVAGILLAIWVWPENAQQPSQSPAPLTPTAQVPSSASDPAASAVPAKALGIELTTTRPVWIRVTADDRRVIERELPAGHRQTIQADRAILIRAGDGGAVRLSVGGKDLGVLGKDGFPANKALTAPQ